MPGLRDRNLRSGDLAEGLGLELLRPFAFVAPVPRSEDIGIDAVATLIRRNGRRLYAEGSFLVQIKASSVKTIDYSGDSLEWLRALVLPLFIMSVDLKSATVELYTTSRACSHLNFGDRQAIRMYLDQRPLKLDGQEMDVGLGPPVLRWNPLKAAEDKFQRTAYKVLKAWILFETENIALRDINMSRPVRWKTNLPPSLSGVSMILHNPKEFKVVLQKIKPNIERLILLTMNQGIGSDELLIGLVCIASFMRRQGVDPDPIGILPTFAKLRSQLAARSAQQPGGTDD